MTDREPENATAEDVPAWRKRVMRNGRWTTPKDEAAKPAEPSPSDFRYMSVKLRRAEIEEFKETCVRAGVTPNRAM